MKKNVAQKALEVFPDVFANIKDWSKAYFEDNAKDILDNSSGTIGLILKTVGKTFVDKYFDNISKEKLENFGLSTYIKSSYNQAVKSIQLVEEDLNRNASLTEISMSMQEVMEVHVNSLDLKDTFLVFQPKYHPAVIYVKNNFTSLLKKLNVDKKVIDHFINSFNKGIESQVKEDFGTDYENHLSEVYTSIVNKQESDFLLNTINLGKIGFDENESLKYEVTYGKWKEVHKLHKNEQDKTLQQRHAERNNKEHQIKEDELRPAIGLIEEYFSANDVENIERILFIVADFGKGKSVFLKHYAASLAKEYLINYEGYFPIYFNLRDFSKYAGGNSNLGVINDYLQTKHGIKIDSEYYANKKYLFLIDSLDESGELNKSSIDNVVESIKRIQNLDRTRFRTNKIVITTRPFDGGLETLLHSHCPHTIKNKEGRDINLFISLFGFKKTQFNDWLVDTLKKSNKFNPVNTSDFIGKLFNNISTGENIDIHEELIKNGTLSHEELRRPIFAYMIYQLVINNVDFLKVGKIGVYLSFLNLLSKEAKHINDPDYKVNLNDEFGFRNMLHVISSLWMFERHQGKQGSLNKADICRVLDKENKNEGDSTILERYKNKGVTEIRFLSHSYFGENNNTLHFQHQSFAEILLAEYYLKVFIKYALEKTINTEEARTKLVLGIPTEQTIIFFRELIQLLKETSTSNTDEGVIEKRKLLFPLFASLATEKNNLLFCNSLYYEWFNKCDIQENQTEYPEALLHNWCISEKHIEKILILAKEIINSNDKYYLTKSELKTALYNNELTLVRNNHLKDSPLDIDKWLALLIGNKLYNDTKSVSTLKLFNKDYSIDFYNLLEMITSTSPLDTRLTNVPAWGYALFQGIDMRDNKSSLTIYKYLPRIDFSYSIFKDIRFVSCVFYSTIFNNCIFENVNIHHTYFFDAEFKNIKFSSDSSSSQISIENYLVPFDIFRFSYRREYRLESGEKLFIPNLDTSQSKEFNERYNSVRNYRNMLDTLADFIIANIKHYKHPLEKFESYFSFANTKDRIAYFRKVKYMLSNPSTSKGRIELPTIDLGNMNPTDQDTVL